MTPQPASRRREISLSHSSPDLTQLDALSSASISPAITLEQATPTRAHMAPPSPSTRSLTPTDSSTNASSTALNCSAYAQPPISPTRSHHQTSRSRSSSASSASSNSSSQSSSSGPEPTSASSPRPQSSHLPATSLQPTRHPYPHPHLSRSFSTANLPTTYSLSPPFYNRPPTPLPPSPSLTSLLRPTFSAAPSRPTTPSESDNDSPSHASSHPPSRTPTTPATPNSAAASTSGLLRTLALTAPPSLPPTSPKVPTYEYYGFTLYLSSTLCFLLYILWAYLPSPFLTQLGLTYYPNRWWALALPAWLVVAIGFIYIALLSYNAEVLTGKLGGLEGFVDAKGRVAILDADGRMEGRRRDGDGHGDGKGIRKGLKGRKEGGGRGGSNETARKWGEGEKKINWREAWSVGTDAVLDVPIGGVCEVLYGDG